MNDITFEEAMASIPDEWTAWQLRSRLRKTKFVATLTRIPEGEGEEISTKPAHADTPGKALALAVRYAKDGNVYYAL